MYLKIKASIPFQGLVLGCLMILFGMNKAIGQVNLGFSPTISNVTVNQTFNVDVTVDFIGGDLNVINTFIDFDPTYLEVISVTVPPSTALALGGIAPDFTSIANMNSTGRVDYGRFVNPGDPLVTTDFTFFTIQFRAIAEPPGGNTTLAYNLLGLRETIVASAGNNVINSLNSGTINIAASCTPPTATIANTPTCDGQSFDLVLDAASGTAPFDLVINGITYNDVPVGGTIASVVPPTETLWTPAVVPAVVNSNDGDEIEVGTKFTAAVNGYVRGVRIYINGTTATGTFEGRLYNFGTAEPLDSAIFTITTGAGWKEVLFNNPVPITGGTTYVVTCYSTDGFYSVQDEYFNGFTLVSGNLTAPSGNGNTDNSSNGVYKFGAKGFPTSSYQNSSYFVDPVFTAGQFSYELTSITGDDGCNATGSLQTLNVTSVDCSTLPVSLLGLSASAEGSNRIVLKWATSSEQNNKGFEILRSLDGRSNWQSIGFVNGAGDSETRKDYSYADNNLTARRYYYQLKQIDFDGRYKYTAVVSANLGGKEGFALEQNFPNPFKSQETTIRFTLPRRTQVQLIVYDMNGRVVKTLVNGTRDAGTHAIPFQDNALPTGIYFYKLSADGYSDVKKMTVR